MLAIGTVVDIMAIVMVGAVGIVIVVANDVAVV